MVQYIVVARPVNHVKHAILWVCTGGLSTPWWIYYTYKWKRVKNGK